VSGNNVRASVPFFLLCLATFAWQCTWVFLFESEKAEEAVVLAKVGYAFILFIPTTFYHLAAEMANRRRELTLVFASYLTSAVLLAILLGTNEIISGTYRYFFGEYPKAGNLFFLHLTQTVALAIRVFLIIKLARHKAKDTVRRGFSLCLVALGLYYVAMIDYLANYGYAFYPPGVAFVAASLGMLALSMKQLGLVKPVALSTNLRSDVDASLTNIRSQVQELARVWPDLLNGYRKAVEFGLCEEKIQGVQIERMPALIKAIAKEVDLAEVPFDQASERFRGL
jgi:hypothetical protein